MAERAVHLSGALTSGPSLLETECAGRLDAALHPGLRHLLSWLAEIRPNLQPIAECADELYLLLSTLLHTHYLNETDGSFGESFYGLCRKRCDNKAFGSNDKLMSLLWLTAIPYVCLKLEQKLMMYRLQVVDGILFNIWELRLKRLICFVGSALKASGSLWRVLELTDGNLPALKMQGLHLSPSRENREPSVALQALAFSAQLAGSTNWNNTQIGAIPPPPKYDNRVKFYLRKCPICGISPPKSPTAISTSGYVYCFSCIIHHVQTQRNARCPVTLLPVSLHHLVRIYQTS